MLAHPPVSWVSLLLDPQPRSLFLALCFPLLQVCSNIWSKVVGETKCMRAATKRIRFHFRAREINTRKRDSFSSITHWGIPKNRKGIECHRIHTKKVVPFSFPLQLVKKTKRKCHDIKKEKPRWNESRHARCGTKRIESPSSSSFSYWLLGSLVTRRRKKKPSTSKKSGGDVFLSGAKNKRTTTEFNPFRIRHSILFFGGVFLALGYVRTWQSWKLPKMEITSSTSCETCWQSPKINRKMFFFFLFNGKK